MLPVRNPVDPRSEDVLGCHTLQGPPTPLTKVCPSAPKDSGKNPAPSSSVSSPSVLSFPIYNTELLEGISGPGWGREGIGWGAENRITASSRALQFGFPPQRLN